jgi:hypothetical protein
MEAVWAATSPSTGRFAGVETRSTEDELLERCRELRERGEGYLEVRAPDRDFPCITLGFRGPLAVINLFDQPESVLLRRGDGSVAPDDVVEVPIMDDPATFTGMFVMTVDRAWELIQDFVRTGSVGDHEDSWQT